MVGFFFFKQKTAYEMRISDWSSDVCSSDLELDQIGVDHNDVADGHAAVAHADHRQAHHADQADGDDDALADVEQGQRGLAFHRGIFITLHRFVIAACLVLLVGEIRSEEHTSELQSLMRISYAVFCLK